MSKYKFSVGQRVKVLRSECDDIRLALSDGKVSQRTHVRNREGYGRGWHNGYTVTKGYMGAFFYESELTAIDQEK